MIFDLVRKLIVLAIAIFLVMSLICILIASYCVYNGTLVRRPGKNWGRQISEDNPNLQKMWDAGIEWSSNNQQNKKDVEIRSNDGLKLIGEFYDYGFKKTIIILPGRRECLIYSYYYAMPYKDIGVNVLVIDHRAHGLSEGKYATAGILEAEDVILWSKHLHDYFGQEIIYLHGICVGTSCSINVIRNKNCPEYIKGAVLDSTPISYQDIFGNHMIELGHKLWPTFPFIWMWFHHFTKTYIEQSSPIDFIGKVDIPVCFIHGTNDAYCSPEKIHFIYDKCPNKNKEFHWIEHGTHSKVRYQSPEKYDSIIKSFFSKI